MAFDITGQLNLRLASGAVRRIAGEINSGLRSSGVGAINVPVRADVNSIRSVVSEIGQATNAVERFAQQSGLAFKRFTAFSIAAIPFIQVASGIRSAITEAVEFDKQMVRLRQVATGAGSEVGAIGREVSRLSANLGVSSQDLIKTAVTLKQANLSITETKDALEALAKSALAPNFDSVEQTVEGAIAVMNQFKIKSKDLEAALGSMNAVAGEFAVEASDLIEVVRRTGGAFAATGGDLNQLLGLFTSVRQTTRESAESIATGLRTIFTRIQRNDTVESLKQIGVQLRYTKDEATKAGDLGIEGQFVGAYEAIRRLSAALTQLPQADPRYSAIVENLGGYRQISKVIPLIQEFAVSERALMVAEAGRISLNVNAAQAAESYANKLTKLKESYLEFGRSMMDTQGFKATFGAFEEIAKGILSITNALRPVLPLLTAFAAVRIGSSIGPFVANFGRGVTTSNTHLLTRASGGIVPGVGDSDSVPMSLAPGSFVIKKSSVRKLGASNLRQMGSGGVPTMLTPGEYVFSPEQAKRIGISNLNRLNSSGSVRGYQDGGLVTDQELRERIIYSMSRKGLSVPDDQIDKVMAVIKKSLPHEQVMSRVRESIFSSMGYDVPKSLEEDLKKLNKSGLKEISRSMGVKTPSSNVDEIRQVILSEISKSRPPLETAKRKAGLYGVKDEFVGNLSGEFYGEANSQDLLNKVRETFISEYRGRESRRTGLPLNKVKFPKANSDFWEQTEELSSMRHYDGIKDSMMRDPELRGFFSGKSTGEADRELFRVINPRTMPQKVGRAEMYSKALEGALKGKTDDFVGEAVDKYVQGDPFSEGELNIGKPSNYLARQTVSKEERQRLIREKAEARKAQREAEKESKLAEKKALQEENKKARAEARAEARKRKLEEQELIKQQIRDEKEEEISTGIISDKPNRGILGDTLGKNLPPVTARRRQFAEVSSLEEKTKLIESSLAQRTGEADINNMGPIGLRRLAEKLKKQSILSQEQYDEIANLVSTPGFDGAPPPSLVAAMKAREQAFEQESKDLEAAQKATKSAAATKSSSKKKTQPKQQENILPTLPVYEETPTPSKKNSAAANTPASPPPPKPPAPPAASPPPPPPGGGGTTTTTTTSAPIPNPPYRRYPSSQTPTPAPIPDPAENRPYKKYPSSQTPIAVDPPTLDRPYKKYVSSQTPEDAPVPDAPSYRRYTSSQTPFDPSSSRRTFGAGFDRYLGTADKFFTRLDAIAQNNNVAGNVSRTASAISEEDLPQFLSEMSRSGATSNILTKTILQALEKTRPDLGASQRLSLANSNASSIFDKANAAVSLEETARNAESLQKQAQQRIDDIKRLPQLIDQTNALSDRAKVDPVIDQQYSALMADLNKLVLRVSKNEGIGVSNLIQVQGGKTSLLGGSRNTLEASSKENEAVVANAKEEVKRAREESKAQILGLAGIGAEIRRDVSGQESVQFSGVADVFGAGPQGSAPRNSLGKLLEDRINTKLAQVDPVGQGTNVSAAAKEKLISEETSKLHDEYVRGRRNQIMAETGLTSQTMATASASEEFARALENGTRVMEVQTAAGKAVVQQQSFLRGNSGNSRAGSYQDVIEKRMQAELAKVDPTGSGSNLPEQSKARILQRVINQTNEQLLASLQTHVRLENKINDSETVLELANRRLADAIENNVDVQDKNGRAVLRDTARRGYDRSGSRLSAFGGMAAQKIGNMFTSQSGFFALQAGASFLGDSISNSAGGAEAAIGSGSQNRFVNTKAAGSALQGAGLGASVAMGLGFTGIGLGVSAAAGALLMFTESLKSASNELSEATIATSLKKMNDSLSNFAKGMSTIDPATIRKQQNDIDNQMSQMAKRNSSIFGLIPFYSSQTFNSELDVKRRETAAAQVPTQMDALTKIIEEQAKNNIGENARDERSRRKLFEEAIYKSRDGLGASLLGRVASGTNQDYASLEKKLFDSFRRIQENEVARKTQETAESKANNTAAMFSNFSSVLSVATQQLSTMAAATKNLTDIMDGSVAVSSGASMTESLQRPFAGDNSDFMVAVKSITSMAGASGGDVEKSAEAISVAGRVLPSIINAVRSRPAQDLATGANFSVQVSDMLRQRLEGQNLDPASISTITNLIQSQLGEEDFTKLLRKTGEDVGAVANDLLAPIAEPLKKNLSSMGQNLQEKAKIFANDLTELGGRVRAVGELMDKANFAQISSERNRVQTMSRRGLIREDSGDETLFDLALKQQELRQARLTGFGGNAVFKNPQAIADAQNPEKINEALKATIAKIGIVDRKISAASRDGNNKAQFEAQNEMSKLKVRAADLGQALKNLTDTSERNAAAQERLTKIQADREGRQSLGMRYATSNLEGRADIAKSFSLLSQAGQLGTAAPFSVRDQNQIFSLLSSLSPQMRLQGLGGISVKELSTQLLNSTFGGAFDLDPQSAAMEKALDSFVQQNYEIASRAAQLQVDNQDKLLGDFFSRLQNNQQAFLESIAKTMADVGRQNLETQKSMAISRVKDLEKNVGDTSIIGKLGIKTDEEFKMFAGAIKNPNMSAMIDAGGKMVAGDKLMDRARGGVDNFASRITNSVGGMSVRDIIGNASGAIKTQLEEIGFTDEKDRTNILVKMDEYFKERNINKNIGNVEADLKKAFLQAASSVVGDQIRLAREDFSKAESGLRNSVSLPDEVIKRLSEASQRSFDTISISSLEKSVGIVNGMNVGFSKMGDLLKDAKTKLDELNKAIDDINKPKDKKANGGLIRFFNKGGWGSEGSLTPHSSDTVNARINPNEFVVSSGPAQKNKALLERINSGLPAFAEGGEAKEAYARIGNLGKLVNFGGSTAESTIKNDDTESAKDLIRKNATILFLSQIKSMDKEKRTAFLNKQIDMIGKDLPKNDQQAGVFDALMQVLKIRQEKQKAYDDAVKAQQDQKNAPVFPDVLPKIGDYHTALRQAAVSRAFGNPPFEVESIISGIKDTVNTLASQEDAQKNTAADINKAFGTSVGESLSDLISNEPRLADFKNLISDFMYQQALSSPSFRGLETLGQWNYSDKERSSKKPLRMIRANHPISVIEGLYTGKNALREKANQELSEQNYPEGPEDYVKNIYGLMVGEVTAKVKSAEDLRKNAEEILRNRRKFEEIKSPDFDQAILESIDATIAKLKEDNEKVPGLAKILGAAKENSKARMAAFATPEQRLAKNIAAIDPENIDAKTMVDLVKLQGLSKEAELFNQVNPALQAKLVNDALDRIRQNKLRPGERELIQSMGLDRTNSSDITAEEIEKYRTQESKMPVIQRAYLRYMAQAASRPLDGKDPGTFNEAEKALYLMTLEQKAQALALARVQDKEERVKLDRLGRFLLANPGLIDARMSGAEEKGADTYAQEAALLSMVFGLLGKPTTFPSVSSVFKGRPIKPGPKVQIEEAPEPPPEFGVKEAGEMKFAVGGLVPGVGNTDSVRTNLPVGSYVVRKSSVQSLGAETLASLPHLAKGGVVPAMVMPGEHIYSPQEASKIGIGNLDYINKNGKLPGFERGTPGGVKAEANARAAAANGFGVPRPPAFNDPNWQMIPNGDGTFKLVQAGAMRWGGGQNPLNMVPGMMPGPNVQMPPAQAVNPINNPLQGMAVGNGANANAGAVKMPGQNNPNAAAELEQIMAGNLMAANQDFDILGAKAEFYQLRNQMRNPRARTKENIAKLRELYAQLSNPVIAQMDAEKRRMSAEEALSLFQNSPKEFFKSVNSYRAEMMDKKKSYKERLAAKEKYEEFSFAARMIPPQALRAAMAGENQPKGPAKNDILEKEWKERREGVAAHNARMREQGKIPKNGPEAVQHHNTGVEIRYGKQLTGPEAVNIHNARVKANEQNRPAPNPEAARANHLKKMLDTAQENYLKTGDPKFLEEIRKLKNPEQVRAEEKSEAQRKMDEYRAQKKKENEANDIAQWHVKEGIADIRDPGGVKRKAEKERQEKEAQEAKMRAFYEEKSKKRREFEDKINSNYAAADELRKKIAGGDDLVKRATGGIVPGVGSGDIVPAMLEPGELVVPKKHVQKFANGGIVGGIQGFANGGMAQGGPELLDVAAKFNQAATQISQGLSGFSTSVSTFNGAVANFGTFVDKFDEAVGKIPGQIELSGANEISVNLMGQDSIVKAVTEAIGPMIAEAIRANQPVEQRSQ
jgi:TP901 family phage tail tape measure protein